MKCNVPFRFQRGVICSRTGKSARHRICGINSSHVYIPSRLTLSVLSYQHEGQRCISVSYLRRGYKDKNPSERNVSRTLDISLALSTLACPRVLVDERRPPTFGRSVRMQS